MLVTSSSSLRKRLQSIISLILWASFICAGCGSGGGGQSARTMTSIAITPANPSIGAGSQQQFTATGVFSDGSMSAISSPVVWTSSDTTLVGISGSGLASVRAIGRPQITATFGSLTASTRLIVTAGTSMPAARFAYAANGVDNSMSAYVIDPATGQLRSNGYVMTGGQPGNTTVEPHGKYVYVLNADDTTLSGFSIDGSTGSLSAISGSLLPAHAGPMVFDPSGAFVYVLNTANDSSMSISAFSLDPNTGGLTPLSGSPLATTSGGLTVDPTGKFLYSGATPFAIDPAFGALTPTSAQNPQTNFEPAIAPGGKFAFAATGACSGAIRAFTIDPTNGALHEVLGSPFFVSMGFPSGIAFDSSGQFLYSANFGSCSPHPAPGAASSFSISASGVLTEISSIVVPFGPTGIQVDPGSKFGYIVTASNEIEIISISATGHLSLIGGARTRQAFNSLSLSLGAKPVTYSPQSLYTANSVSNDVSIYSIDATSGALTSKGTIPAGTLPRGIAVAPSQKFAYVANQGSNNVSMYTIDLATGALTAIGTIPAAGTAPGPIAVEPSGRFAYVGNMNSNNVSMFTINPSTGELTANGTIAAGTTPDALAVDPTGRFLYVANQGSHNMSIFRINATTGTLVDEGPLSAGSFPGLATVHPSGKFFYLSNQVNQIAMYSLDETNGVNSFPSPVFTPVGTLTAGTQITSVRVDPTGRFAFVGDVASNAVLEFTIDLVGGTLSPAGSIASGMSPGSISVEPSGRFVYAANQNSNSVSMYAIDPTSGTLTSTGNAAAGTQPVSLVTTGTLQ
jgi:6-phosphogluconolactonase (cycloisomerase 2 family)